MGGDNIYINHECAIIHKGYLWGICTEDNALYKTNLATGEIIYIISFGKSDKILYKNIFLYEDKLVLIPGEADKIVVYETKNNEIEYLEFKLKDTRLFKFKIGIQYNKLLYIFPMCMKYILRIDMCDMSIHYLENPINEYLAEYKNYEKMFSSYERINEQEVMFSCFEKNVLFYFNLATGEYIWKRIPNDVDAEGYRSIAQNNDSIFLLSIDEQHLLKYNKVTLELEEKIQLDAKYGNIICVGGVIWLIPNRKTKISKYIIDEKQIISYPYDKVFSFTPFWGNKAIANKDIINDKNNIYIVPRCCNGIVRIDKEKENVDFIKFTAAEMTQKHIINVFQNQIEKRKLF